MEEKKTITTNSYYPLNENGKKESIADSKYQSTFLPIFQRAETEIKKVIVFYFLNRKNRAEMQSKINNIINAVSKKIPNELADKQAYINGLIAKSEIMIKRHYDYAIRNFFIVASIVGNAIAQSGEKRQPDLSTPQKLNEFISDKSNVRKYNLRYEQKASVRVENYPQEIEKTINKLADEPITTAGTGKKNISLWQKAELDVRHNKQMENLEKLKADGVDLCYISSHPDASERCAKWQGKLVSLTKHATMSGFRVEKVDGQWVYSLTDIMAQKDKYGYNNNIINGFNCRHHLIKYNKGELPPKEYEDADIKKEREINAQCRKMEREIRVLKTRAKLYEKVEPKTAKRLSNQAERLTQQYIDFCNRNGFAYYLYRLEI